MRPNTQALLIDADTSLCEYLVNYLAPEGFQFTVAADGAQGLKNALNKSYDIIILDISLPDTNGLALIKKIRAQCETPIFVLTARSDNVDQIMALELGADDYLHKPTHSTELIARLHALLRRTHHHSVQRAIFVDHNIKLDCAKRLVTIDDTMLELTNAEFNILEILMKSSNQAFSKEELTVYALGRKYTAYDRSIDVHISNLRNKLGLNPAGEPWIKTVRAFGYLFNGTLSQEN